MPLKAHLSDVHIVSMPDDTTVTPMCKGFYEIDITTDIRGQYEDVYLEFYVNNKDGLEAPIRTQYQAESLVKTYTLSFPGIESLMLKVKNVS